MPRLRDKLIQEEPLLGLADQAIQAEKVRDDVGVMVLKSALKRAVQIRYQEDPDTAGKESIARRQFVRGASHIDENPPLKSGPEQGLSEELKKRLLIQGRYYDTLSDQYSGVLARMCFEVHNGKSVTDVLLECFCEPDTDGLFYIVEALDMFAAGLSVLERRELSERLDNMAKILPHRKQASDENDEYRDGFDYITHDELRLYLSTNSRALLSEVNKPQDAHGVVKVGETKDAERQALFAHNGGEIMAGRMLIPAVEGYNFGNRTEDDGEDVSIWLQDRMLDKTTVVPGFTTDAKLDDGLYISPADRDPYDISSIEVIPDRVKALAHAYHEGGMGELASLLEVVAAQPQIRLDIIVDIIQHMTQYDETIGWAAGDFDITKLQSYGLVKHDAIVGNCSVSAAMLCHAFKVLGQTDARVVGGIPLNGTTGYSPLHAQVIFKNGHGDAYIADAQGAELGESVRRRRIEQFIVSRSTVAVEVQEQPSSYEQTIEQHAHETTLMAALTEAKGSILDAALLMAQPTRQTGDLRDKQFAALMQLSDEHAAVTLYRELMDAPLVTPTQLLTRLNDAVDRYERWIANERMPHAEPDVLERFRSEAAGRQAAKTLYSDNIANVYQLRNIVTTLRQHVIGAAA